MKKGFTLIELLVVIVIVGILATIGVASYNSYQDKARRAKITAEFWQDLKQKSLDCLEAATSQNCSMQRIIGTQIWTGFNSNVGVMETDKSDLALDGTEKHCYNDDEANCNLYGGFYLPDAAREACPDGWRIPTRADLDTFIAYANARGGMKAGSSTGFEAPLAGLLMHTNSYAQLGNMAYLYGYDPVTSQVMSYYQYNANGTMNMNHPHSYTGMRLSVRCIKE